MHDEYSVSFACPFLLICGAPSRNAIQYFAGIQGIQQIVRTKQESHVKQFLLAEAALQAGRAAEECMPPLRDDLQG